MKTKWIALIVLLASLVSMRAGTNDLTTLLQRGLFEEEANHNLEAAMQAYQSAIAEHDKDRKLVATAVFRLGECYRKQGKTNEATVQYQRILREYSDQEPLVKLSKSYLGTGANVEVAQGSIEVAQGSTPIATTSEEDEEVRRIKAMIQNSPDLIDAAPLDGSMTPLQYAASKGHLRTVEYLLANGADVNNARGAGAPIRLAAQGGHKTMVEFLLAHGAKVGDTTALYEAASHGYKGVVEVLIAAREDVNETSRDSERQTPLHAAALNGFQPIVEMLISNKADVNARDSYGNTPLNIAANKGKTEIARLLIANGAQVNAKSSHGETPLYSAISSGHNELVKLLLDNGADTEANLEMNWLVPVVGQRNGGSSLLSYAIDSGRADIVELLLNSHANPNAKFGWRANSRSQQMITGETALVWAIGRQKPEIVDLLLAHGADPNLSTDGGSIPVVAAIEANKKEIVQSLIKYKAKLDITVYNFPLLSYAAGSQERASIVEILCNNGLNVNERDRNGMTPLHFAVQSMGRDTVEVLIAHGADVNALDNDGKPPLAYTKRPQNILWNDSEIARHNAIGDVLRKAGANDNYERLTKIWIKRQGDSESTPIFYKGTNSFNRFSLVETMGFNYRYGFGSHIAFPDLSHVIIDRLQPDGGTNKITVNFLQVIQSGDHSKDPWLQWGDIIEIGQVDHKVNENWPGLPEEVRVALARWMLRRVEVRVKGQSETVVMYPAFGGESAAYYAPPAEITGIPGKHLHNSFDLKAAVGKTGLLLVSSDLSQVRVKRAKPVGDEPSEMVLDESKDRYPDLWLRDGDVIEVPERDPNAPANAQSSFSDTIQKAFQGPGIQMPLGRYPASSPNLQPTK